MKTQTAPRDKTGVLFYLFLVTAFFLCLEISFFIQTNKAYLFDFNFVASHLKLPLKIVPSIIFFVLAQLALHAAYCLMIGGLVFLIGYVFPLRGLAELKCALILWALGIVTILTANAYFFPSSKFADLMTVLWWNKTILEMVFGVLLAGCLSVLLIASVGLYRFSKILFFSAASLFAAFYFLPWHSSHQVSVSESQQPNIFIIGIDSLRPDFLGFFGGEANTPFFNQFLAQSTVFSEATTPLARTFPSWTSILSGEYPKQIGIRFNLARQDKADFSQTLASILKQQGYQTFFATDETRFSNIDQHFGFEKVMTAPIGLNDFLLGTFNDFPLSNLIINTQVGRWLFPYNYANRAASVTYEPNTFLNRVEAALSSTHHPLFAAIHFCLPHYPYVWAQQNLDLGWVERYQETVEQADQQVGSLISWLQQNHYLQHAIVIVLSDHGEALELSGDRITEAEMFQGQAPKSPVPRFYPPSLDTEAVDQSAGHGTDVLSLSQYHTLLAVRLYGEPQHTGVVPGTVSTLDIKPTILDFLHKPEAGPGISLKPYVAGAQTAVTVSRDLFYESDYTPSAMRTLYPETRNVMLEGMELFRIDPKSTRLVVKDSMGEKIIHSKQLADIYQNWMLALYPQTTAQQIPILVNLQTGEWTNDMHTTLAQHSPYAHMLQALRTFYGLEVDENLLG